MSIAPLLGAEQPGLLLRAADEQHPLGAGERRQVLMHDVVLACPLNEIDPRHPALASEPTQRRGEPITDLGQRRGRGDRQPQLTVHIGDQPGRVLQPWHINVEIHPVDALHLEHHVIGQHISDAARYRHGGLRSNGRPAGQPTAFQRFIHRDRHVGHGLNPTDRSPLTQPDHGMARRAGAKPR
jgi:hypothetical protein